MKIEKLQKVLCALLVGGTVTVGCIAEAAIDTGKLPLQTYVAKRVYCGNSPGATSNSYWIDANRDLVTIKQYSGEWAYGTYPNSKGQAVTRWFRMSDVLGNINFSNYETNMKQKQIVYRTESSGQTIGTVFNDENVVVVYEGGNRTQIIYRLSNNKGYKMGWVPNSSINRRSASTSREQVTTTTIPQNPLINTNISRPAENTNTNTTVTPNTNTASYQQWQGVANKKTTAYHDSALKVRKGVEWVGKGDVVTVLKEEGNAYYVEYEGKKNGKVVPKERWVHKNSIDPYKVIENNFVTDNGTLDSLMNQWVGQTWKDGDGGFGKGKNAPIECKEFASYIFNQLYNVGYIGGGSTSANKYNYQITNPVSGVYVRSQKTVLNSTSAMELFSGAQPGDFVQMRRKGGRPHSAIYVGKDGNGVWFFEANAREDGAGRNVIQKNYHSYNKLATKNSAMTVYHAN